MSTASTLPRLLTALAITTLVGACSSNSEPRYPARYKQALDTVGAAPVPDQAAQRFVAFFTSIDQPGVAARVDALYAKPVYFSDTLFVTEDRDALTRHFERLSRRGTHIEVDLDDAVISGTDLYLRWRMRVALPNGAEQSRTIGMTQLRFDESGRISFQQDFWDSAEGVYRQIPVLGWIIGQVENRITEEH
jgi:hypothetical protein